MSDSFGFGQRFTPDEMASIRKSLRDEARFGSEFIGRLKRVAKRIPFAEDLLAAWVCTRDPATPRRVKLTLLAALGYFVLPLDAHGKRPDDGDRRAHPGGERSVRARAHDRRSRDEG